MTHFAKKLPPLNTLVAFEAALRLGSFSLAAKEISRSQASVSRQIRLLEDNMGVALFKRERHNVVPTSEGVELGATVKLVLGELASSSQRIRKSSSNQNELTIFSDISTANALISPIVGEFQRLHPELQLKILSSYESIDETTELFDIGLQIGKRAQNLFRTYPIADDAIFPVCSPEFASKISSPVTATQLRKLPLLHLEDQDRGWPNWSDFLVHAGLAPLEINSGLVFTTYDVCLQVAMRGEGVALGWARSVQSKIEDGKLVRLSDFVLPLPECIYVYQPLRAEVTAESKSFIELLTSHIQPLEI